MSRAEWTVEARADLAAIDDHYQPLNADFTVRLGHALLDAARFLAANPRIGTPLPLGTRKWRVSGFDYVLVYRERGQGVEILRVHHVRQNWRPEP
ncbi:MAG TPA: type II toxin-antitoxin system RelE/ParE family toxin [Sphingomonas sp.]|nr:type II toxin-antitoxin system RelE/ParE family toxin [Sphingomonas sp.]